MVVVEISPFNPATWIVTTKVYDLSSYKVKLLKCLDLFLDRCPRVSLQPLLTLLDTISIALLGDNSLEITESLYPQLVVCLLYTSPSPRDRG